MACVLLLAAGATLSADNPESVSEGQLSLDEHGVIHVEATGMSRFRLLEQLQAQTGVDISNSLSQDARVTVSCHDRLIRPILTCVLGRDADFMIETATNAKPVRIRILSAKVGQDQSSSLAAPVVWSIDKAGNRVAMNSADGPGEEPGVPADGLHQATKQALLAMLASNDASRRAGAVGKLIVNGDVSEDELLPVLTSSLTDADARVRAQAVYGLAMVADGQTGNLRVALRDRDPSVRLMVVDSVRMNPSGVSLLQQAVGDPDATISEFARRRLAARK